MQPFTWTKIADQILAEAKRQTTSDTRPRADGSATTSQPVCGWNMQRVGVLWRVGLAATTVTLLVSGCASPEARAGRDLADTVKIDGFRKLGEKHMGETTLLYFVGPAGANLRQAVMARNWSPEPPPPGLPEAGAFEWVLTSSADTEDYSCSLVVSTLRPGFEDAATKLDDKQKQDLVAGRLTYVRVASVCAGTA